MEFYARNDISLGCFLERYCFRYDVQTRMFYTRLSCGIHCSTLFGSTSIQVAMVVFSGECTPWLSLHNNNLLPTALAAEPERSRNES